MKLFTVLILILLTGCATTQDSNWAKARDIHNDLLSRFVPVIQSNDKIILWSGHEDTIKGDCDDYYHAALSRFNEIGLEPTGYLVKLRQGGMVNSMRHVITCIPGDNLKPICIDNKIKRVLRWSDANRIYHVMGRIRIVEDNDASL